MGELVNIFEGYQTPGVRKAVAQCPKCEGNEWLICLDGLNFQFENIYAFECANCENKVWIKIEKD